MATDFSTVGFGERRRPVPDRVVRRRTYTCPACQLGFAVLYEDTGPLHRASLAIDCPRGADGQRLRGDCVPTCSGRVLSQLPAEYVVIPRGEP